MRCSESIEIYSRRAQNVAAPSQRSGCSGRSQAAALAEKVAAFRHPKLSAVRLAGEPNKSPTDGATLDERLEGIKAQLTKIGPLIDLEVMCAPEGSRTEGVDRGEPNNRARPTFSGLSQRPSVTLAAAAGADSKRRRRVYRPPALAQAQPAAERRSLPVAGQQGVPALARGVLLPGSSRSARAEPHQRAVDFEHGTAV